MVRGAGDGRDVEDRLGRILSMIELRFRFDAALREVVPLRPRRVPARHPYLLMPWLDIGGRLADAQCWHAGLHYVDTRLDRDHRRSKCL